MIEYIRGWQLPHTRVWLSCVRLIQVCVPIPQCALFINLSSAGSLNLNPLWASDPGEAIPRALFFYGASNISVLVLSLETGEM